VTSHSSQGQTAERVLIHVDTEKSELLVNNASHMCLCQEPNTAPRFTRMMAASFPTASVAKVRSVRQQRWNNSQLHRRSNQFPCEECGSPKRSNAIVLE
jgi:hypothetical protein